MAVNPLPRLSDGREPVITSGFGPRRGTPPHQGADMAYRAQKGDPPYPGHYTESRTKLFYAPSGVPVLAYDDGVVVAASMKKGINGDVWLHHEATGKVTRYAHLASLFVTKGQRVKAGAKLGVMGRAAKTPFRHLHFAVLTAGRIGSYEDPAPYLNHAVILDGPGLAPSGAPREAIATAASSSGGMPWLLLLLFGLVSTRS